MFKNVKKYTTFRRSRTSWSTKKNGINVLKIQEKQVFINSKSNITSKYSTSWTKNLSLMESLWLIRLSLCSLMNNISKKRQWNFPWNFFRTRNRPSLKTFLSPCSSKKILTNSWMLVFSNALMKVSCCLANIIRLTKIKCKFVNNQESYNQGFLQPIGGH